MALTILEKSLASNSLKLVEDLNPNFTFQMLLQGRPLYAFWNHIERRIFMTDRPIDEETLDTVNAIVEGWVIKYLDNFGKRNAVRRVGRRHAVKRR